MARGALALLLLGCCAACATEQHTTVVAQPTVRAAVVPSDAQLVADSQAACVSYRLLRGSAPFDRCVATEFAARRPG